MNSGESLKPWEELPLMDTETDVCFAKDMTSEALQLTTEDRLGTPELTYAMDYRRWTRSMLFWWRYKYNTCRREMAKLGIPEGDNQLTSLQGHFPDERDFIKSLNCFSEMNYRTIRRRTRTFNTNIKVEIYG
ncbi:hypothetical protein TNCV_3123791 [Trichonephila clavipes]|nr:hypothetical protein TNCV_3123791 [Trichonephila clavipes]